ncbi:hypothetical protein L4X63_22080 [Geomonas sp. Red32]|uniref:hypothetical protein n=1 Tax=Geomonas sp. Red32 TaxID=2912856 RepID=UPI00202CFC80|nr:hypothetical protein [Geomonas sp. Red32]MCM0084277.1 hypothetical protein [Geomonas sp. Red32]
MDIQRYPKSDIALNQIETALVIYFGGGDLFSVVTLAGAAEELIGQLLASREERGFFKPLFEILRPGKRRNEEEPLVLGETGEFIHTDPRHEAIFLLGRSIDDYRKLTGAVTPSMARFDREVRQRESAIA